MKKTLYLTACAATAQGGGIYRCTLEDGHLTVDASYRCDRPMYTVLDGGRLHVLLRQPSSVPTGACFSLDLDLITPGKSLDSCGVVPCHLAADGDAVWWVNYLSGNIVKNDASIATRSGSGPNAKRQEMPHTHFVSPLDERYLGVCDLGCDALAIYDRNLAFVCEAHVPAGYGIRHFVQDRTRGLLYSVNELVPSVSVFAYADGTPAYRETVKLPCLSPEASGAAIRLSQDGRTLYVSVRGENAIYTLDVGGKPIVTGKIGCCGDGPRDFDLVDFFIVCANEKSGNVSVVAQDGRCVDLLPLPAPLCITVV